MMTPMDRSRSHGVAHIGAVHHDGVDADGRARTRIEWFELFTVTRPGEKFGYGSWISSRTAVYRCYLKPLRQLPGPTGSGRCTTESTS